MVKKYFGFKRHFAQVDWDDIEAYARSVRSAAASGALMKEQIVLFKVFYPDPNDKTRRIEHNVTILSSESWNHQDPIHGAKAIWQYIYLCKDLMSHCLNLKS